MGKIFYSLVLLLVFSVGNSQNNYSEEEIFKRANDYSRAFLGNNRHELPTAEERKLMKNKEQNIEGYASKKALECFELLIKNFPSSKNISDYYYQLGNLEYLVNSLENSKINLNKSIETNNLKEYNLLRKTYILLTKISIDEKKFDEALIYFEEIEKNRPEHPICGNQLFDEWNEVKPMYEVIKVNCKSFEKL